MQLQTIDIEGKTYALVQDGKPVYKGDDGKDVAFDAAGTVGTISRITEESKGYKTRAQTAETAMKAFEGLDANAARDAIEKLSKIDAKKLVEAGDMDAAIQAAIRPYADKLALAEKTTGDLTASLNRETIGNRFAMSKFATEKLTPAGVDLVRTIYGDRLKIEDGKVVGYGENGEKLVSRSRPGELSNFDEIIETLVDTYPHKDHIMRPSGADGSGAQGKPGPAGSKTITRAQFDALSQPERAAKAKEGVKVVDA